MNRQPAVDEAVDLLQRLGLKEYEAKCFVALTRLPNGTAKEISEISEVPRTRVYDAIRVLESRGLVEVQHSNPQRFRAVSIDEATETLRREYASRTESLKTCLEDLEPANAADGERVDHEVWSLSGVSAIENRLGSLLADATSEVVVVVGTEHAWSGNLADDLRDAIERGVDVLVGTADESVAELVADDLPEAEVFVSGLTWLTADGDTEDGTELSRILLVDRETLLVGTEHATEAGDRVERAVFGRGFDNGVVVIARRLMATGLPDRP